MERLTERENLIVHTKFVSDYGSQNILQRLADFEDTGLEPEEVAQAQDEIEEKNEFLVKLCDEIREDEQVIADLKKAVSVKDKKIKNLKQQLGNSFTKHLFGVCNSKDHQIDKLLSENKKLRELLKKQSCKKIG